CSCLSALFLSASLTPGIYPLSLHDALPISSGPVACRPRRSRAAGGCGGPTWPPPGSTPRCPPAPPAARPSGGPGGGRGGRAPGRSEEHTSELQSRENLVCRLLLEKKKNKRK